MGAPVYCFEGRFIRVCYDGWMYELPNATAHNYEGRGLKEAERDDVRRVIADGRAKLVEK